MNGITQSLSKELGMKNIRVNAICPVLIRTDGLLKALSEKSAPGHKNVDSFLPIDTSTICYLILLDLIFWGL